MIKLSGFADEISDNFVEQLEGLRENNIEYIEIRGVNGKNISGLNQDEILEAQKFLEKYKIGVSAIGSPIGKIDINDEQNFDEHLKAFENCVNAAKIFGSKYIRMFSFFIYDKDYSAKREKVMNRLEIILNIAEKNNIVLAHENEGNIYGESSELCLDIYKHFNGRIKLIFDPANYLVGGFDSLKAYELLRENNAPIEYMHIKDANETGIVVAGAGNGNIKTILKDLIVNKNFNNFLSIEPHLSIFSGLDELEGEKNKIVKNKFATKHEAFAAATNALKDILKEIY